LETSFRNPTQYTDIYNSWVDLGNVYAQDSLYAVFYGPATGNLIVNGFGFDLDDTCVIQALL
jgi:hypothetical protein